MDFNKAPSLDTTKGFLSLCEYVPEVAAPWTQCALLQLAPRSGAKAIASSELAGFCASMCCSFPKKLLTPFVPSLNQELSYKKFYK